MGLIAKQCVEKIDNVRVHAGEAFATLILQKDPQIQAIPQLSAILKIFPHDFCMFSKIKIMKNCFCNSPFIILNRQNSKLEIYISHIS